MHCLEHNEIWEWCAERGIPLQDKAHPADDAARIHRAKHLYATGERSGREGSVALACARTLSPWAECLVWITLVGVWSSTEDWPAFYAFRGLHGEKRSVETTPGYLFEEGEEPLLVAVLTQIMDNGWDAYVLPVTAGAPGPIRAHISHDEWIELQGESPVQFPVAAV